MANTTSGVDLFSCISLARGFVRELINGINARFLDLPLFNAAKIYCPSSYEKDVRTRSQMHKGFMQRLCTKFGGEGSKLVDATECEYEIDRFCLTLYKANKSFSFHEAWEHCSGETEWVESYPNLMRLWQALLVIPVSTAACERGFSKQNRIKDDERSCLTLTTLDTVMFISLSAPHALDEVDWEKIYEIWASMKFRRVRPLSS